MVHYDNKIISHFVPKELDKMRAILTYDTLKLLLLTNTRFRLLFDFKISQMLFSQTKSSVPFAQLKQLIPMLIAIAFINIRTTFAHEKLKSGKTLIPNITKLFSC